VTVVLSSHLIADLERVCDYLVVLVSGHVAVAGDVDELLNCHQRITGPRRDPSSLPSGQTPIEARHVDRQSTMLVRSDGPIIDPSWVVSAVTLDDVVLAYMRQARDGAAADAPMAVTP
jgi:ABC-2 type transport system ATP-binding protein